MYSFRRPVPPPLGIWPSTLLASRRSLWWRRCWIGSVKAGVLFPWRPRSRLQDRHRSLSPRQSPLTLPPSIDFAVLLRFASVLSRKLTDDTRMEPAFVSSRPEAAGVEGSRRVRAPQPRHSQTAPRLNFRRRRALRSVSNGIFRISWLANGRERPLPWTPRPAKGRAFRRSRGQTVSRPESQAD